MKNSQTIREAYAAVDNRGPGFDLVRLLAASAVVLHHSLKIEYDIVKDDWLNQLSGGYTHLGLLAVSIFFALSGFLVVPGLLKSGNVVGYLSRRFMRIMPLLVVIVTVTALVIGPIFSQLPPHLYFSDLRTWRYLQTITTFLSLQLPGVVDYDGGKTINGPIWTLHFEWMCYLVLAVLGALGVLRRRWLVLALYVASQLVLWGALEPILGFTATGRLHTFLLLFGYFGAGVLMYQFGDVLRWSRSIMAAAFIALLLVYPTPFVGLLAPALTAYLVVGAGLLALPMPRFIGSADLSYGVYLTHSVILMMLMNIHQFQNWYVLFAICWPISMAAAMLTWHWIEKPALAHKSLPEHVVRRIARSLLPPRMRVS